MDPNFKSMLNYLLTNWATVIITFIITWFAFCIVNRYKIYKTFTRLGIPGPKPHLLYGNFHEMIGSGMEILTALDKWMKEFGPVFGFYRIKTPTIVVTDPDIIKAILIKDFHNFTDRPLFFNRGIGPFQNMLHILQQERWKQVRRILTPTFSAKKMKQMSPHMNSATGILLEILDKSAKDNKEVNIKATYQGLTLQVIGECAFNLQMNCQRNEKDPFLITVRGFFSNINKSTHSVWAALPEIEWLFQPILRAYHEMTDLKWLYWLHNQIKKMIQIRREISENHQIDVLQLLLNAADNKDDEAEMYISNGTLQPSGKIMKSLTENEIESNTFTFLLVGYETTATSLTYVTWVLAKYPEIQKMLQQEVDSHLGKEVIPDYESVQSLQYMEQVVNETLRIYPPVSFFVARNCTENFEIKGYHFPKNCAVVVPVWNMHHNPDIWDDPEKFDPERFSPENKNSISQMSYLPFGAGPRNCIGMRFALLEVKVALARILQRYSITKGPNFQETLNLMNTGAFLQPKDDLFVKFVKR